MTLEDFKRARKKLASSSTPTPQAAGWEDETLAELERLRHLGMFLYERGLNSRAMDDWNYRLAQLAHLNTSSAPGWLERRTWARVMGKFEDAALKELRRHGLLDEWRASWERDSARTSDAPTRSAT